MIHYYRFFTTHAADLQSILYDYVEGLKKKEDQPISWPTKSKGAFEKCKLDLGVVETLYFPNAKSKLAMMVDASNDAFVQ